MFNEGFKNAIFFTVVAGFILGVFYTYPAWMTEVRVKEAARMCATHPSAMVYSTDKWHKELKYEIVDDDGRLKKCTVTSSGRDQKMGTYDDIAATYVHTTGGSE